MVVLYSYTALFWLIALTNAKIPCDPDSFQFIAAPEEIRPNVDYVYKVNNREEIGCAIKPTYFWKIFDYEKKMMPVKEEVMWPSGLTNSDYVIVNFENVKEIFEKTFVLRVVLIPRPTHYPSYRQIIIKILAENYNFFIDGGTERIHRIGEGSLWLNATSKRETGRLFEYENVEWTCIPKFQGYISKKLTWEIHEYDLRAGITHFCKVNVTLPTGRHIVATQNITILPPQHRPIMIIRCIKNCNDTEEKDTQKETILMYECLSICLGIPSWSIDPYDEKIQEMFQYPRKTNDYLHVPPGTFEDGMSYKIVVSLGGITTNYTLVYNFPPKSLEIKCIKNCFDRTVEIVLQVTCSDGCEYVTLYWDVAPYPRNWTYILTNYTIFKDTLSFEPYTFPRSTGATVAVQTLRDKAVMSFTVNENTPVIKITCLENCKSPNPRMTNRLKATCIDNCNYEIKYSWIIEPFNKSTTVVSLTSSNTIIALSDSTFKTGQTVVATVLINNTIVGSSYNITFVESMNLSIECIENCPEHNFTKKHLPILLRVHCTGTCEGIIYEWTTFPPPFDLNTEVTVSADGQYLFIPGKYFPRTTDVAEIYVTGGKSKAKDTLTLKFQNVLPDIQIICVKNCLLYTDPSEDAVFIAFCGGHCENIEYMWDTDPEHYSENLRSRFDFSPDNMTITLKKNCFAPNDKFYLQLNSKPIESMTRRHIIFLDANLQLAVECTSNCESWIQKPVILDADCVRNCHKLQGYTWTFASAGNFKLPNNLDLNNKFLYIPANTFTEGTIVECTVTSGNVNASFVLQFKELSAVIDLICKPVNCSKFHNPLRSVEIIAECLENCKFDYTNYKWLMSPLPEGFRMENHVVYTERNHKIIITENSFTHNSNVTVTVIIDDVSKNVTIRFYNPQPEYQIICEKNCNPADPHEKVHLAVKCDWRCEYVDSYIWTFEPPPPNPVYDIEANANHEKVVIYKSVYNDGDVILVTAWWSVFKNTYKIHFLEREPVLKLICLKNCEYVVMFPIVFKVECVANCSVPSGFLWTFSAPNNALLLNNNKTLLLPAQSFNNNLKLIIKVSKGKGFVTETIIFKKAQFALKIECVINCYNYKANPLLSTVFKVICLKYCKSKMDYNWMIDPLPFDKQINDIAYTEERGTIFTIKPLSYKNETTIIVGVRSEELEVSLEVTFYQPLPILRIICTKNCGYPKPSEQAIFKIVCFENCDNLIYDFEVFPYEGEYKKNKAITMPNRDTIIIQPHNFRGNESVILQVTVGDAIASKKVMFATNPPKFRLKCKPQCFDVDPRATVQIFVKPLSPGIISDYYHWRVWPIPDYFIWSFHVILGFENSSLTIRKHTFKNGSQVEIVVQGSRGSIARQLIKYHIKPPTLSLICYKNCKFYSGIQVVFQISCKGNCIYLKETFGCLVTPEPSTLDHFIYTTSTLVIYYKSHIMIPVHITCYTLGTSTDYTFRYSTVAWIGTCSVEPSIGMSLTTVHNVECIQYSEKATFSLSQVVKVRNYTMSVLLSSVFDRFIPNFLLGPGNPVVLRVDINIGNTIINKKILMVNSTSFRKGLINESSKNMDNSSWNELVHHEIIIMLGICLHYFKSGQIDSGLQLAFIIEQELHDAPAFVNSHVQSVLIRELEKIADIVEPMRILSLTRFILSSGVRSPTRELCSSAITLLNKVADSVFYDVNEFHLTNLEKHLAGKYMFSLSLQVLNDYNLKAKRSKIRFRVDRPVASGTSKKVHDFRIYLLKIVVNVLMKVLAPIPNKNDSIFKAWNADCIVSSTNSQLQFKKLVIHPNKSFVQFYPFLLVGNKNEFMNVKYCHLNVKIPLDRNEQITVGQMNLFAVTFTNKTRVFGPSQMHIKLPVKKEYQRIQLNEAGRFFKVWKIFSIVNGTLEIKVHGNHTIFVGSSKVRERYLQNNGVYLLPNTSGFHTVRHSPTYISMIGYGPMTLEYVELECLSFFGYRIGYRYRGCKVSNYQPEDKFYVICNCYLMPLSIALVSLPRYEPIEFKEIPFFIGIRHSFSIPTITMVFVAAMSVLFVLAVWFQRKFQKKLIILSDTNSCNKEIYVISVQTGFWLGSGTTAHVAFRLYGTKGNSKVHLFNILHEKALQRNSSDCFLMFTRSSLGEIQRIKIWHDSTGGRPDWYCESIAVQHLQSLQRCVFVVFRWFSFTRSPYTTIGIFKPQGKTKYKSFLSKIVSSVRWNYCHYSFIFGDRIDWTYTEQIAIAATSLLLILGTSCLLVDSDRPSLLKTLKNVGVIVAVSSFVILLLNTLFCNTRFFRMHKRTKKIEQNGT